MQRAGLDEAALAAKLGRRPRGVACWVRGERLPNMRFVPVIASCLLLPGEGPEDAAKITAELKSDTP